MNQSIHAGLEDRFEDVPDPLYLKVARAAWRVTSRSARATWGGFCWVAENEAVRGTVKVVGGLALVVIFLPFVTLFGLLGMLK